MAILEKPTSETAEVLNDYPPPLHLQHSPIWMMPLAPFDGPEPKDTDAMYLGAGLGGWRDGNNPLSMKIFRFNTRWSRQAEDTPMHRAVDQCILMASVVRAEQARADRLEIPAGLFEHQKQPMVLKRQIKTPPECAKEIAQVDGRLRRLCRHLNDLGFGSAREKEPAEG